MKNLENKCVWKEIVQSHIVAEGNMTRCKACDGYNTTCDTYFSSGENETKFRAYKMRDGE